MSKQQSGDKSKACSCCTQCKDCSHPVLPSLSDDSPLGWVIAHPDTTYVALGLMATGNVDIPDSVNTVGPKGPRPALVTFPKHRMAPYQIMTMGTFNNQHYNELDFIVQHFCIGVFPYLTRSSGDTRQLDPCHVHTHPQWQDTAAPQYILAIPYVPRAGVNEKEPRFWHKPTTSTSNSMEATRRVDQQTLLYLMRFHEKQYKSWQIIHQKGMSDSPRTRKNIVSMRFSLFS
jgi:hypothetical protein